MKRLSVLAVFCILLIPMSSAQELESSALLLKDAYPQEFEKTIQKHAISEKGFDYSGIIDEINGQANSLVELAKLLENEESYVAALVALRGSRPGFVASNLKLIEEKVNLELKDLIRMNCNWIEVKAEFDRVVAKRKA